jgi:excisionase family DNA binding protein
MVEYVNIMEAARLLGVSDKTIRRWIHAHRLPARFPLVNTSRLPFLSSRSPSPVFIEHEKGLPVAVVFYIWT